MRQENRKNVKKIVMMLLALMVLLGSVGYQNTAYAKKSAKKVTTKERNRYFSDSGFIGSSIGVGQKMYFDSQGKGYLGNPTMMVRGCYSFSNDASGSNEYKIRFRGVPYRAKDAIAKSGVKKVFINMGTNDMWKDAKSVCKDYVSYLQGIRKRNPKVIIFIESTTPTRRNSGHLNNTTINYINKYMKKYCKKQKDMYFIDITTGMKDRSGFLKSEYCSDGYVHLSMKGYAVWMKKVIKDVDFLILQEKDAKASVKKVEKTMLLEDYQLAKSKVQDLEKSTVKDKLLKRLKKVKPNLVQITE